MIKQIKLTEQEVKQLIYERYYDEFRRYKVDELNFVLVNTLFEGEHFVLESVDD